MKHNNEWKTAFSIYEGCPESNQPFWISQESVACPWCNLTASQRKPYCASVNSHSPVGLVSQQWDAVDWACVLRDRRIHNDRASRPASSQQWPAHSTALMQAFYRQSIASPYSPDLAPCDFWLFSKLKVPFKGLWFVNVTVTQYTSSVNGVSLPND